MIDESALVDELHDLLRVEQQTVKALPKLAEAVQYPELTANNACIWSYNLAVSPRAVHLFSAPAPVDSPVKVRYNLCGPLPSWWNISGVFQTSGLDVFIDRTSGRIVHSCGGECNGCGVWNPARS